MIITQLKIIRNFIKFKVINLHIINSFNFSYIKQIKSLLYKIKKKPIYNLRIK